MDIPAQQDGTPEQLSVFGPRRGYAPHISILVSQLKWMRAVLLDRLRSLSVDQLDWLASPHANSIGALLMHLAATDAYYGLNTFDGVPWGRFSDAARQKWAVAMNLGETARIRFRGFELDYYLSHLSEVRQHTLIELSGRGDDWLMEVDPTWGWGQTNNLCKWFHVCEHESHHLGQIDLILKQLPGRQIAAKRSLQKGQASRTALGVALRRAAHQMYDDAPLVLDDPIVVPLLQTRYASALADEQSRLQEQSSLLMRAWLVARNRFAEDHLAKSFADGTRQYVLLGAGLDTFALRNPHPGMNVYEVDHAATQGSKEELLGESGLAAPDSLHFVPVDFETERLSEKLKVAGLDVQRPTVFAMLGVVVYLTADAFSETLRYIASFPKGSGIIFDYALPRHLLPSDEIDARDELATRVESIGEPFQLFFTPEQMKAVLGAFERFEDLDDQELNRLYFTGRTDQLTLQGRAGHVVAAFKEV